MRKNRLTLDQRKGLQMWRRDSLNTRIHLQNCSFYLVFPCCEGTLLADIGELAGMKRIESTKNATIKKLQVYIDKSRDRKRDDVFVVEGIRENQRAILSGYEPLWLFFDESHSTGDEVIASLQGRAPLIHECTSEVFSKIALRSGVPNWVGLYKRQEQQIQDIAWSDNPLVLVLEAIEKPGNLGAILRSASAAKVEAVFLADSVVDFYHPQAIRNSLGGFFDVPLLHGSSHEVIKQLSDLGIPLMVTTLEGATPHYEVDLKSGCAVVMGAEDRGVTSIWLEHAKEKVKIPMSGVVDSLNVSVAAAVMLFEANRQRSI